MSICDTILLLSSPYTFTLAQHQQTTLTRTMMMMTMMMMMIVYHIVDLTR